MAKTPPIRTVAPTAKGDEIDAGSPLPHRPPEPLGIPAPQPKFRPLKVYAFGPSRGGDRGNIQTLAVPYEKLAPGPVGARIAVVDYDTSNRCFYDPVDLDDPLIAMNAGLDPSDSDPTFHQQMVYAVVSETLHRIEVALGRTLRRRGPHGPEPLTLTVYPHYGVMANAAPEGNRIKLGYYQAPPAATNRILPGQTVFSCLDQDSVSHTCAQTVISAVRPDLDTDGHGFQAGLSLAIGDFTALLFHFRNRELVFDTIQRTAGVIYQSQLVTHAAGDKPRISAELTSDNPLLTLSPEFGDAFGRHGGLRNALMQQDAPAGVPATDPYLRAGRVVAAIFDAMFSVYQRHTADLFRIHRAGGGRIDSDDLPEPLALRLCDEVDRIATRFFQMCWRALDYCPPISTTIDDFLRACITADYDYSPDDPWDLRDALTQAFRIRGIVPKGVAFFSEDTLRWPTAEPDEWKRSALDPGRLQADPDAEIRAFVDDNKAALGASAEAEVTIYPLEASRIVSEADVPQLTWTTQVLTSDTNGRTLVFDDSGRLKYAIPSSPLPALDPG
jgi:hypothetical protein